MKFPYYKFRDGLNRPVIQIEVCCNDKKTPYYTLIDSGADMNLFHSELAEILNIDIEKGVKRNVGGINHGESQVYYVHQVTLCVGGWKYETTVGFMPSLSKNGYGVLGQTDFFNLFKRVSFDFNKKEIELIQKA